jgi:DNA polymerase III subunit chi
VVINLADVYWCDAPIIPDRVLELVSTDLDEIAAARQRFRTYRDAGFVIEHHDMRTQK